jgi:death-on-curing family protein
LEELMHYLSVHDLVWINTTLVGKTLTFDYRTLEEAMAAQYSYGESKNVSLQAANLLDTLVAKQPFAYGNRRTGFLAVAAFLNANGYALQVDDSQAADLIRSLAEKRTTAPEAIATLAQPAEIGLRPGNSLRSLVTYIFNTHTAALQSLTPGDE